KAWSWRNSAGSEVEIKVLRRGFVDWRYISITLIDQVAGVQCLPCLGGRSVAACALKPTHDAESYTIERCQNTRGGNNGKSRECASGASRRAQRNTVAVREVRPSNFGNRVFERCGRFPNDNPNAANSIGRFAAKNGTGAESSMGKSER